MGTRETLANVEKECAWREGESHLLKRSHPHFVKPLQMLERICAAPRQEPHFENRTPSICEPVA
eukprot:7184070-Pyramimonas_sp.AAC.1